MVTLGEEPPKLKSRYSLTFDWNILETVLENSKLVQRNWPRQQGDPIVCIGFSNWESRIPTSRRGLWRRLAESGVVHLEVVKGGLNVGGVLRSMQVRSGDILVTLGGGPGVEHLVNLYVSAHKHAIALDLPLKKGKVSASERIAAETKEHPERYFDYRPTQQAAVKYSLLTLRNGVRPDAFERKFYHFVAGLAKPQAFFVRLLNPDDQNFKHVEFYFRNVVDPVIKASGYARFEMGKETTEEAFLNAEIFRSLDRSTLVICDLTGLRPNCLTELGFALGSGKRVIVLARKGTPLPFDAHALPCNFWGSNDTISALRSELVTFMGRNINRRSPAS